MSLQIGNLVFVEDPDFTTVYVITGTNGVYTHIQNLDNGTQDAMYRSLNGWILTSRDRYDRSYQISFPSEEKE